MTYKRRFIEDDLILKMDSEKQKLYSNFWKIGFFILLILIIIGVGYYLDRIFVTEAYAQGYNQGVGDVVIRVNNNQIPVWNPQLNRTVDMTIGQICSQYYEQD